MIIGDRLKTLRESKSLSQGDVEKRTGLLRCCISRVENGHAVPSVEDARRAGNERSKSCASLIYDGEERHSADFEAKIKDEDDLG